MQGIGEPLSTQWRVNLYETKRGGGEGRGIERTEVTERRRKRGRRREEEEKKGVKNLTAWSSPRRVISRSNTRER